MTQRNLRIVITAACAVTMVMATRAGAPATQATTTITLSPTTTHQTMSGWAVTAEAGELDEQNHRINPAWAAFGPVLIDRAVNDLGLTQIRIALRSGAENPVDYFQQWLDGTIFKATMNDNRYNVVNDNGDPNSLNANGFKWSRLDQNINLVINPFRAAVTASGQTPYVYLGYVDFEASPFKHATDPAEYAEFILAAFSHIQATFGWAPNAVEIILEPDNTTWWTPVRIGHAIVTLKSRLAAAGFHPDIVGPSSTNFSNVITAFDTMIAIPGVSAALTSVSYHLYGGNTDANRVALASRASAYGMKTAMLELIGANHDTLSSDMRIANVSAWTQHTLAWPTPTPDDGGKYYLVTGTNPVLSDTGRYLRQYFRYIRPGAVRIAASTSNGALTPVAVINPGNRYTVVVNSTGAQTFSVGPLPAGTYGIRYTTASATDVNPGNQTASVGGTITVSIPGPGVLTLFDVAASTPPPPGGPGGRHRRAGVEATGFAVPRQGVTAASASTSNAISVPASQLAAQPMATRAMAIAAWLSRRLAELADGQDGTDTESGWRSLEIVNDGTTDFVRIEMFNGDVWVAYHTWAKGKG